MDELARSFANAKIDTDRFIDELPKLADELLGASEETDEIVLSLLRMRNVLAGISDETASAAFALDDVGTSTGEAADNTAALDSSLGKLIQTAAIGQGRLGALATRVGSLASAAPGAASALSVLAGAVGVLGAAGSVAVFQRYSDFIEDLDRLEGVDGSRAFNDLAAAAARADENIEGLQDQLLKLVELTGDSSAAAAITDTLADVSTVTGTGLAEVLDLLTLIGPAGEISAESFNSLENSAVPALERIAEVTGRTVEQVRELGEAGDLRGSELVAALESISLEAPTIQTQDLSSEWAELTNNVETTATSIGGPLSTGLAAFVDIANGAFLLWRDIKDEVLDIEEATVNETALLQQQLRVLEQERAERERIQEEQERIQEGQEILADLSRELFQSNQPFASQMAQIKEDLQEGKLTLEQFIQATEMIGDAREDFFSDQLDEQLNRLEEDFRATSKEGEGLSDVLRELGKDLIELNDFEAQRAASIGEQREARLREKETLEEITDLTRDLDSLISSARTPAEQLEQAFLNIQEAATFEGVDPGKVRQAAQALATLTEDALDAIKPEIQVSLAENQALEIGTPEAQTQAFRNAGLDRISDTNTRQLEKQEQSRILLNKVAENTGALVQKLTVVKIGGN